MVKLIHHKNSGGGNSRGGHGGNNSGGHGGGSNLPHGVKSAQAFQQYKATSDDWEGIRNALYDTGVYPAAGTNQLTFFSVPNGQGTSWTGAGTKNDSDTNMQLGGMLPADQRFLMESIEIHFTPCLPQVAKFLPYESDEAPPAGNSKNGINDTWVFRTSGNLVLRVASKPYLTESPLMVFPAKTNFEVMGALSDSTTAGSGQLSQISYANAKGRPYIMHPYAIGLDWGESFAITLNWQEGVQALPSGNPAIVRLRLDGILQRKQQ